MRSSSNPGLLTGVAQASQKPYCKIDTSKVLQRIEIQTIPCSSKSRQQEEQPLESYFRPAPTPSRQKSLASNPLGPRRVPDRFKACTLTYQTLLYFFAGSYYETQYGVYLGPWVWQVKVGFRVKISR